MSKLIILRGAPASGKSTFAKTWVQQEVNRVRISRDDLRAMLFTVPNHTWEQEKLVTAVENTMIENAINERQDVVVDACHLRAKYVTPLLKLAKVYGVEVEFKDFPISLEDVLERNSRRSGLAFVPEEYIKSLFDKFIKKDGSLPKIPVLKEEVIFAADRYDGTPGKPKAVIFDIDGTLAENVTGRSPYSVDRVCEDAPKKAVIESLHAHAAAGHEIIFCSGRSDLSRTQTEEWLSKYTGRSGPLFMRKEGDYRKDFVVKRELFDFFIRDNWDVISVFDDRTQVVEGTWRAMGMTCMQVERGDF